MGMQVGNEGGGFQSEINITPLVDVVLVLLIIFMVIVPLTLRGYDLDIPGPAAATPVDPENPPAEQIVLGIDASDCPVVAPPEQDGLPEACRVRVNDDAVAVGELAPRIAELFAERKGTDRVLFLTADDAVNYEAVMRILDVARSRTPGLRIGFVRANA